ncbi:MULTISPECIES: hypothetical protein [unclassified Mycoplasma]|uniref:hypothetical protein n=1 Tax=unclassified Mycoplasma TaxID=2683645 RepID=UPI00216B127C|nr:MULTISPECIES: hypothetical protein [unclassified Mycoplasma]MCS4536806.1 hypothetical protein [Mycoplasma sp. CSL7475-4]MCT4469914.1 hypothetical protein [Mycoplasma sp. HS2188]
MNNNFISDTTAIFSFNNIVNIISAMFVIWPIIYQSLLIRQFVKKYAYFRENNLITTKIKQDKRKNIIDFAIVGSVGSITVGIIFAIGEIFFRKNDLWITSRYGVLILWVISLLLTLIGFTFLSLFYRKLKATYTVNWKKVSEYIYNKDYSFKDKDFEIRWLDPVTKRYEEANQKDISIEWKRDYARFNSFSKGTKLKVNIVKWYISRIDRFFFKEVLSAEDKLLMLIAVVLNQLTLEGEFNSIESAIEQMQKHI